MKTTIGGDRLGAGGKQQVTMKSYERSTHDMGYVWRSTMASGTLVPFMSEVALPGDSFDIDLNCEILTQPTIGPLFGSYKAQLDVFQIPVRLYQGQLHMNKLGIGMSMKDVKLPQMKLTAKGKFTDENYDDNAQINPSSLLSYLNIRGLGRSAGEENEVNRAFNAIPYLGYWDIYKNYYANKQEEVGVFVGNTLSGGEEAISGAIWYTIAVILNANATAEITIDTQVWIDFPLLPIGATPDSTQIKIKVGGVEKGIFDVFTSHIWDEGNRRFTFSAPAYVYMNTTQTLNVPNQTIRLIVGESNNAPILEQFPLENIDKMRELILTNTGRSAPFIINEHNIKPYSTVNAKGDEEDSYVKKTVQHGLGIKTYQSDLFNNWISTEWIDGDNGVNSITAVDTSSGEFTIDALNLSRKVYDMLNRIALSGGTYDDWLDSVYTHERQKAIESPMYLGGLIRELAFQEVISNTETADSPLGTLAGRGVLTQKKKGGQIKVRVDEPSYIMGIVSLTPRIDYSQGNKWDVNLETMDDFHKPALDEIGFQDLITDQMAWMDTRIDAAGNKTYKSAGKQPAWLNYMTNVNQIRGNFAVETEQMFMTLNRRYEYDPATGISDLTTYIDPSKFNQIFAYTRLDAQNFWVQIGVDISARRKMSARLMPNL